MIRTAILITSLLVSAFCALAQPINGLWKGRLVMEPGGCFPVYNIEMQITASGTRISGNSYHYSDTSNYVKEAFTGLYDSTNASMIIEEQQVSVFRIPADCIPCIKKYTLTYHTDGKEEQLRGSWTGRTMDGKSYCPPGTIVLTRILRSAFQPPPPPLISGRRSELVREIFVDTGLIRLDFYDNGTIDGDTISVYVNNVPVVTNKVLALKPVTTSIHLDIRDPVLDLIMVGENLGAIPPNTALMIISTADARYKVALTSDDKKNSLVRFIYKHHKIP